MGFVDDTLRRAPLLLIGRWLVGVALLGLGLEHFIFNEFVTGRAPGWPNGVPGKLVWVYGSGLAIISTGVTVLVGRRGRLAAVGLALIIFVWALLRHVPTVAADSLLGGTWTRAGKALALVGGLFAVAATLPPVTALTSKPWGRWVNAKRPFVLLGQISLGCFFIVGGVQHYLFTDFVASLIPSWFPGNAVWWVKFAGVALVAGGLGVFVPRTAALAGVMSGLMIFSWFWIVHLPRTFISVSDGVALFEALSFSGLAFVIAGALSATGSHGRRDAIPPDVGPRAFESRDRDKRHQTV